MLLQQFESLATGSTSFGMPLLVLSAAVGPLLFRIDSADYVGSMCQQQGLGFYFQLRMKADSGVWLNRCNRPQDTACQVACMQLLYGIKAASNKLPRKVRHNTVAQLLPLCKHMLCTHTHVCRKQAVMVATRSLASGTGRHLTHPLGTLKRCVGCSGFTSCCAVNAPGRTLFVPPHH